MGRVFESKHGFITLCGLARREAIKGVMKVKINTNALYNLDLGEGSLAARLGLKFK
jgi:hypothetical protein